MTALYREAAVSVELLNCVREKHMSRHTA